MSSPKKLLLDIIQISVRYLNWFIWSIVPLLVFTFDIFFFSQLCLTMVKTYLKIYAKDLFWNTHLNTNILKMLRVNEWRLAPEYIIVWTELHPCTFASLFAYHWELRCA